MLEDDVDGTRFHAPMDVRIFMRRDPKDSIIIIVIIIIITIIIVTSLIQDHQC